MPVNRRPFKWIVEPKWNKQCLHKELEVSLIDKNFDSSFSIRLCLHALFHVVVSAGNPVLIVRLKAVPIPAFA